jgi:chromosome segregation ATPase
MMKKVMTAAVVFGLCAGAFAAEKPNAKADAKPDLQQLISDESAELKTLMHEFNRKADAARARVDEIDRLKKEISDGDKAIAALEQEQEKLRGDIAQRSGELASTRDALKKTEGTLAAAQSSVTVKDAAILKAQEREKALVDQVAALSEAVKGHDALVKAHELVSKERDAYADRVGGLEKNAKVALEALAVKKTECETQTVRAEKAEGRIADLTKTLTAKDTRLSELDGRIAALTKTLEEMKASASAFQSRAISAEEQNTAHEKNVTRLTNELSDAKAAREKDRRDTDAVITKLRTELTERKKMIVELISRVQ